MPEMRGNGLQGPRLLMRETHRRGHLPLSGRRVVVTRAAEQAPPLLAQLTALGADAISMPTIAIAPPSDPALLDLALAHIEQYSGFIFTSANAVRATFQRARLLQLPVVRPAGSWVCAVGPATAAALEAEGGLRWRADVSASVYRAEGVLDALGGRELKDQRILLPRARVARDLIPVELARRGALVMTVEAYQSIIPPLSRARAEALFPEHGRRVDAVLFTSSSTVRNLAEMLGPRYSDRLAGIALGVIGPVTRDTVRRLGLTVALEARTAEDEKLAEALVAYWSADGRGPISGG